jgi:benzoyl-CoA 2,3-dioxygenase component A
MTAPLKQHVIDPEICIRCHTCEEACPIGAITHDEMNVVVDASKCNFCMDCISPCPTGSIDNWRVVATPYTLEEQLSWMELPPQEDLGEEGGGDSAIEALDDEAAALLAEAHKGAGGAARAPASASKPSVNLFTRAHPAIATVQGNYRLTDDATESDIRHIILDLNSVNFPVLEGQSVGVTPPGIDAGGRPHHMRLYSVSSPRDGERPNTNNLSLTVKREEHGPCSNYLCDLQKGAAVELTGPYGSTFLMPNDPHANLVMICTGTGSAPFRAFTMRRQRTRTANAGSMTVFFGARSPDSLPYFGPLNKVPDEVLKKHLVFSRLQGSAKEYVQDRMRAEKHALGDALRAKNTHVYVCGLKAMEDGVEQAFEDIASGSGLDWATLRDAMRKDGRYHVETY